MRPLQALLLLPLLALLLGAQLPPLENPLGDYSPVLPEAPATAPPPADTSSAGRSGFTLAYSILVENRTGGVVRVIEPPAQLLFNRPGTDVGKVTRPATVLSLAADEASYLPDRSVSYSALDALKLRFRSENAAGAGQLSILPRAASAEASLRSEAEAASIETTLEAGTGIFGGRFPVTVGSPVYVFRLGKRVALGPDDALEKGDVIVIEVAVPETWPSELLFENKEGGSASIKGAAGTIELGSLMQPELPAEPTRRAQSSTRQGVLASGPAMVSLLFARGNSPVELSLRIREDFAPPMSLSSSAETAQTTFIPDLPVPASGGAPSTGSAGAGAVPAWLGAFIYPSSGIENPDGLPLVELLVLWKGSTTFLPPPLTFTAADLPNITAIKLAVRASQPAASPGAITTPRPSGDPSDPPGLREH